MSSKTGRLRASVWFCAGVSVALLLSGCQSIRQATGVEKTPPDEFTVLTKSPLVIPPDFNLHPPQPGIASRNDPDADETGGNVGLPSTSVANLGAMYSDGEKLLLTRTNALTVDPNIRKTITSDVGLEDQGPAFAQKVLFQGANPPKPAAAPAMANPAAAAPAAAVAPAMPAPMPAAAAKAPAPAAAPAAPVPAQP
jgi:hypothetical protein